MPRIRRNVTCHDADSARIPDDLVEVAIILADLEARGVVEELAQRLGIRRQGGYAAVDVWLALLVYLAGTVSQGLRPFWKKVRLHARQLAAVAGRKKLPSPASSSRALSAVESPLVRPVSLWMLTEAAGVEDLLRHPSVCAYDALGQAWHVFDYDPTVEVLRHRALPVDDDLPEAMRRSEDTAAPGYPGRKRGDVQYRRVDVQHAGSGLWVHAHLHKGNGEGAVELKPALDDVVSLAGWLGHPLNRTLFRMDGESGNVPSYTACREAGVPFLTRVNRPKLFEDPEILTRLRTATWYRVPDSLSGPRRAAAEIGVVTLHPDRKTRRPDGSEYEPISVRVVAGAFPKEGTEAQRGVLLDGWQVELFAVDVAADAWPAPDAVALFYGRAGQENRFAQEDREAALGRIVSYHLPGQELASLTGLFLMNYRNVRGFELERPPAVRPTPALRVRQVEDRMPVGWPRDPVVIRLLSALEWPVLLARRFGWRWDEPSSELRCPEGRTLALTSVRPAARAKGGTGLIFCRPQDGCEDCVPRSTCLRSARPGASKHFELAVPGEIADVLRERLALVRGKVERERRVEMRPSELDPGIRQVIGPRFLPTEARRRFREIFTEASLRIHVKIPPPEPPRPRLVCGSDAERQRRRLTWSSRNAWNALPDDATVGMEVFCGEDLRRFVGESMRRVQTA
jgi:hypothetical protein